jgi:hypothetical protein
MRLPAAGLSAVTAAALLTTTCAGTVAPITYSVMPSALTPVSGERNKAKDFGRVFCSTLAHLKDPEGHAWGDCAKYIDIAQPAQSQGAVTSPYRFLLVGGFGGECLKDVRAFGPSIAHLKDAHGIAVEYFAVPPYAPSEENGKAIAKHIDEGWSGDRAHRYVLIGYDKGAADLVEALRVLDEAPAKVAAVVTIAGIVGGIWRPEDLRLLMQPGQPWISASCPGNVQDAMASVTREVRQSVLRASPLQVPGYSIVAASTLAETSSALRPMWKRLSLYARDQDGEVIGWEGLLPDGKYLGTVKADHWAVALPFDETPKPPTGVDRSRFPRDGLLEAIVRFVTADLPAAEPAERQDRRGDVFNRLGS